jgi:hypothetical protein|tara:strand:- start:10231 stop:10665 length:435 start_codon:yes stop_codon:yes gene_type:complete
MNTLFSKYNLKNLRFKLLKTAVLLFLLCSHSFGQMGTLQVDSTISSGIIIPLNLSNDIGLVQFKIDNFNLDVAKKVVFEFEKYTGEIIDCGYSVPESKVIVSYQDPMYINYILAILDRVNIRGYYELNGVETRFVKDGNSRFVR